MLFAGFSLSCLRDIVCVMCGIQSVLCEVFSLCYVQILVSAVHGFSLCYVQSLVCVMFNLQSVLYAVFCLSYV